MYEPSQSLLAMVCLSVVFSVKSSQANQTELAQNCTEAAGFKVYTKLHIAYCEHAEEGGRH